MLDERQRTDQVHINQLFRTYRATRDRRVRNEIVEAHRWVAVSAARRFANRGESTDDLVQVAQLGLVKAAERFDPDYGADFPAFALPTVIGEVRRHFRDATWAVHVTRRAKELHQAVGPAVEALTQELGHPPTTQELATHLGVTVDDILRAGEAGAGYRASSLTMDSESDDESRGSQWTAVPTTEEVSDLRVVLASQIGHLSPRQQTIVYLRFVEERTQREISEVIGVSQVHVSRLLREALGALHTRLTAAGVDFDAVA